MTDDFVKSLLSNHHKWVRKYKKDKIVDFAAHIKILGSYNVWELLKSLHNESFSDKEEISCFCDTDNCNKNKFLPKIQEYIDHAGVANYRISCGLLFISVILKYIWSIICCHKSQEDSGLQYRHTLLYTCVHLVSQDCLSLKETHSYVPQEQSCQVQVLLSEIQESRTQFKHHQDTILKSWGQPNGWHHQWCCSCFWEL